MKQPFLSPWLFYAFATVFILSGTLVDAKESGPTPYPDVHDQAAWPGAGPIRVFGWMVDKRKSFWAQRENDQGAIVFIGDSLTDGWKAADLAKMCEGRKFANRGIGGDVSRGVLFRLQEDALDLKPSALVLCIGTNDLSAKAEPAVIAQNIAAILAKARQENPKLPIVLCEIPPRNNPEWLIDPKTLTATNARIAQLGSGRENVVVIDLYTALTNSDGTQKEECFVKDHLHLAEPGYEIWAGLLQPALQKLKDQ